MAEHEKRPVVPFMFGAIARSTSIGDKTRFVKINLEEIPKYVGVKPFGAEWQTRNSNYTKLSQRACKECPVAKREVEGVRCERLSESGDAEATTLEYTDVNGWKDLLATALCHPEMAF